VTVDDPEIEYAGRRVVKELGLTGLVEVEFKKDLGNGTPRLLDINLRVWGWHTIARGAGLDFPYLAWRLAVGNPVEELRAPAGVRWLRLTTDLLAGVCGLFRGELSASSYLRTLFGRHEAAVAARDDPLPGLVEVPLFLLARVRRMRPAARLRRPGPSS
jgi:D-aspartate ligase